MRFQLIVSIVVAATSTLAMATPKGRVIGSVKEELSPEASSAETRASATAQNNGKEMALMRAVLWAVEPAPLEVRTQAIEDLGLLGDVRALNVLAQLVVDPNPAISKAAVRAVALIQHPRAEEILGNIARHPTLPDSIKIKALELLPFQNTTSAVHVIQLIARNAAFAGPLQPHARRVLAEIPVERGGGT